MALWRPRPGIPGLPHSAAARSLESCWRLWVCFLLSGVALSALAACFAGPFMESTLGYAARMFSGPEGDDSWHAMHVASQYLRDHPGAPVYQDVFFDLRTKFQYPLTSLLITDLPAMLPGISEAFMVKVLQLLARLCLPLIAIVFTLLFVGAVRQQAGSAAAFRLPPGQQVALAATGLASVLLFYPITRSEFLGQIQTFMTLAAGLALLAWQRGSPRLAGVMIGLCCIIKPHWGIVIVWAAFRRQWSLALPALATATLFGLIALWKYGLANMLDYIPVVSFIGKHGEGYYANQSVNGLVNRMLFNGNNLEWLSHEFAPFHTLVHAATLASSILLLGGVLLWKRNKSPSVIDLALVMLTLTIASPIAWEHHYGLLLATFAVLLPAVVHERPWGAWALPLTWVAFILTSQSFVALTNALADTRWNFAQSYLFFGALIVLALLYRVSWIEWRAGQRHAEARDSHLDAMRDARA
ncbi:glycosyltransferase family 87 protein [Variovorax saccharolyticus]|uniref:glycosyltransferase family 87 protein n=1 Tax=Variovorax saccharolyticus TaxID=3053516 RepID=UPI002577C6EC|nr:glycosyltransferase family 87 protein [Variovorax sp. J31P216]